MATISFSPGLQNRPYALPAQASLRFSGKARETSRAQPNPDEAIKAIGDMVVWQCDGNTLTVADMVDYLCWIRPEDDYHGAGTVPTLVNAIAENFPDMDAQVLEVGFNELHNLGYLGYDQYNRTFWLRPEGEEMMARVYPDIDLPPINERVTHEALTRE